MRRMPNKSSPTSPALVDWSEDQLRIALETNAQHVTYNYNDLVAELDRRRAERSARRLETATWLAVVAAVASAVAAIVAVLRA